MQRSENANADVDTDTNSTISKPDEMSRLLYKSLQQLVEKTDKLVETNFIAAQRETEERAKGQVQQRVLYLETNIDMLQEKKRTISESWNTKKSKTMCNLLMGQLDDVNKASHKKEVELSQLLGDAKAVAELIATTPVLHTIGSYKHYWLMFAMCRGSDLVRIEHFIM